MESKLVGLLAEDNAEELLIEPVWNRNKYNKTHYISLFYLLIEPVWNRNMAMVGGRVLSARTFNRTSMESKRTVKFGALIQSRSFNRTSMESKLL